MYIRVTIIYDTSHESERQNQVRTFEWVIIYLIVTFVILVPYIIFYRF